MYDYIRGSIEEINPAEAVIDCCGIGYLMQISLNTYERLRDAREARLYVYHHVREDEETLYGFFDKEVYRYIFREIELLSVIGAAVGLAIGVPLHQFVIRTVESEQMMFIRMLEPTSFLYSVALTLLFTVAVCRAMRRQVRSISMVESMKAPE